MDSFDVKEVLESFRIIADTREQATQKARERMEDMHAPIEQCTLNYGDYAANITLPDGMPLHDISTRISPPCVIERKMSLDETAACFTRGRDRFRREFERACNNNAKVYLLIENASFEAISNHRYRSRYNPSAMLASLVAWCVRYDVTPIMCKASSSGSLIREILYRDIKQRLECGEYG